MYNVVLRKASLTNHSSPLHLSLVCFSTEYCCSSRIISFQVCVDPLESQQRFQPELDCGRFPFINSGVYQFQCHFKSAIFLFQYTVLLNQSSTIYWDCIHPLILAPHFSPILRSIQFSLQCFSCFNLLLLIHLDLQIRGLQWFFFRLLGSRVYFQSMGSNVGCRIELIFRFLFFCASYQLRSRQYVDWISLQGFKCQSMSFAHLQSS